MRAFHIDVKTVFLYGELNFEIYMKQPEGFVMPGEECLVCKFVCPEQSARCWNLRINEILINLRFRRGNVEPCLYTKGEGDSITFVLIYGDDIIGASKSNDHI